MAQRCHKCHAEIRPEWVSLGGTLRCEYCGTVFTVQSAKRPRVGIGIHPALARRYHTIIDSDGLAIRAEEQGQQPGLDASHLSFVLQPSLAEEGPLPPIPGYELMSMVGKGAMGNVYQARHLASGRDAAVKVLSKELASRKDLVARFEREAAALRSFRHPNVVAIFDSGFYGGIHYYCMEFCHGITLRQRLKEGPLPVRTAIYYMRSVLKGLSAAHDRGIIHRDLKPENIMVEPAKSGTEGKDRILLVDFGLAGIVFEDANPHPNLTHSKVTMGTVNYMAPEQHLDAKRVDKRTDIYACGVIFYECLTGDLPLGRFLLPSEKGNGLPTSIDKCLSKALARQPEERYQSAKELDVALAKIEKEIEEHAENFQIPLTVERTKVAPVRFPVLSQLSSHLSHISPFAKRPRLAWGALSLVIGLLIGYLFIHQVPKEMVVGAAKATPIFSGTKVKLPPLRIETDSSGVNVLLPRVEEEKLGTLLTWQGNSPVWQKTLEGVAYLAQQGTMGHLRRDMSFLRSPTSMPENQIGTFKAQFALSPLPSQIRSRAVQQEDQLGVLVSDLKAAGGIFWLHEGGDWAVGMAVLGNGTCELAELRQVHGFFQPIKVQKGLCRNAGSAKVFHSISIQCLEKEGICRGYYEGQPIGQLKVANWNLEEWKVALGCQNMNCYFKAE